MKRTRQSAHFKAMVVLILASSWALPSSHREAPFVTEHPKVDGTDFYMFRSYEEGRDGFVTLIANYLPLQDAYGGPNYFSLDPSARYEIHIDNDADAVADITFQFRFQNTLRDLSLQIGGNTVSVPLLNLGQIGPGPQDTAKLNVIETYTVNLVRRTGTSQAILNADTGATNFNKPVDNIGKKSIANYAAYAANHIYNITIPGCDDGKMFVGQRRESFNVNLGEIFDLINLNPVGDRAAAPSATEDKNITSLALEVPTDCLSNGSDVIGGWTTALLPRTRELNPDPTFSQPASESSDFVQVSRLGMPLVNEVVIGLPDKNRFNASHPIDDKINFLSYFSNPTLPEAIANLFAGVQAPTNFPRFDLWWVFLEGIPGINFIQNGAIAEMLRLNTATPQVPADRQNPLGVLGGDEAGFPNGRRPGDDALDAFLRVVMGAFCVNNVAEDPFVACQSNQAPSGGLPFTDQTDIDASFFDNQFPYLRTPLPGSVIEDESGCDHKIYFPRFVVGDLAGTGFTSLLTLKNLTKKTCTGTLFFYKDNFNPMLVRCNNTLFPRGERDITLGPLQGTSLSCDRPPGPGGAQGFAVFEPGPGCWPSDYLASAKTRVSPEGDPNRTVDLVGVTTSYEPSTSFRFAVEGKNLPGNRRRETAFSMAPCSTESYDYTLEFWSLSGGETVTKQGTATGPIARFVSEALSELGDEYEGSLHLETSEKIQPEVLTVESGAGVQGGLQLSPVLFDRDAKDH